MDPQTNSTNAGLTMGTKIAIGVIVLALVLVGILYFIGGKSSSRDIGADDRNLENSAPLESTNPNAKNVDNVSTSPTGEASLASIWSMSGEHKCDISMAQSNAKVNGVVYVSQGKVRADFNLEIAQLGKSVTSSLIQKDGEVYSWTNMYPKGFKAKVTANSDPLASMGAGSFKANPAIKYSCVAWASDSSKFELPAGITFAEAPSR